MFSKSDNIQDDLLKRIQSSENFYRIRDAEDKMIQQKQKLKKKLKLQEKNEKNGLKYVIQEDHASGAPSSIFTAHTLNKDPEVSKYLLFNEIIYPKISKDTTKSLKKRFPDPNGGLGASLGEGGSSDHLEMDPVEELEKMWVNGFIDRSIRDKDKMIGMKKNKKLKLLKPLMKDQYRSGVKNEDDDDDDATGSIQSNPSVSSSSGPSSSINEPKMSSIQSKKSLSSSCSSSSLSLPSRFDPSNELIKSKKLHRSDEKQANEALKAPSFEPDDATSSLSVNDKYRLKLLTNSIKNHQKQKKSTTSQTFLNSLKVYETQNRHMKQSSSSSMLNKQSNGPSIHSIELDAIFDVERIETLAAKKIQRAYIHSRLITKLRHVFHCMLMAVKIQKHIRGYLIRKRVAIWYQQKSILMIRWQCRIRKYLSNLHLKQQLYQEQHAVIRIQTIIRRKLAQIKIFKLRRNLAAIHIQALWRGCCARIKSDRLWLNKVVIPIQVLMRKMVSRLRYQSIKDERINAAITIQRSFRSWLSIQKLSTSLNNREDIYREYTLAMLTAEEEWADDTIIKLTHRLDKKEIREKLQLVNNDYQKTVEEIHYKENDLIELQRQKDILSARAIQQGWLAELEQNIITTRNEITALKMKLIFKKHVLLNSLETQLENKVQEIEKVGRYRNKIADYRDQVREEKDGRGRKGERGGGERGIRRRRGGRIVI